MVMIPSPDAVVAAAAHEAPELLVVVVTYNSDPMVGVSS